MIKKALFMLVLVWGGMASALHADTLRWAIPAGDRIEMVRTASSQFLINGKSLKTYEERNIADLTCVRAEQSKNQIKGLFSIYQRETGDKVFSLLEQHSSEFVISSDGTFTVPDGVYMPNLRNIPSFQAGDVKAGASWQSAGELVLNNFSVPFKITFPVQYRYRKDQGGTRTGLVDFEYEIDVDLRKGTYPPDFPVRIVGSSKGTMAWDLERGVPLKGEEQYRLVLMTGAIKTGVAIQEYRMKIITGCTLYPAVNGEQQEREKEDLKKALTPDRQIDVDSDERGIVLRLGEVFFDFNSSSLREAAQKNLDLIVALIREKYRGRELIVEGHTDSTGERDYNFGLSADRARAVAEYLKPGIESDKISFRGLGPDKPVADNATPEGRQKNRRVEIVIKLH